MLSLLARVVTKRPKTVLLIAAICLLAAGAIGGGVAKRLAPFGADDPHSESVIADKQLEAAGFRESDVVVLVHDANPRLPSGRRAVAAVVRTLRLDADIASISGFFNTRAPAFIARDSGSTYLSIALHATDDTGRQDASSRIVRLLSSRKNVSVGGPAAASWEINQQVERNLRTAELYAFPIIFLLSILFFRSVVAALLPLIVGGMAIVGAFFVLRVASGITSISVFALNVATGLGLGLAIDYSLFIVNRYREEIAETGPGHEAMTRTLATAGRTVAFSAITVAGALASLMVFPQRFLYSMAIGGSAVALVAALIALVVLPAVLTLLGRRVNSLSPAFLARRAERDAQPAEDGRWFRLARFTGRRPLLIAAATVVLLVAAAIPALHVRFTSADARALPKSASARIVDDALRSSYAPYRDAPIILDVHDDAAIASETARKARSLSGVAAVSAPRRLNADNYEIAVFSSAAPLSALTRHLVSKLRSRPGNVLVTGTTAHFLDLEHSLESHLPIALAIVVALTFLVLFLMTGSILLPIKQLLVNALGLAAVYGLLTLVFQQGHLQGALSYTSEGGLDPSLLLLITATVFGLSTDYGVFVLSRIKEAHDNGQTNSDAIALGLERSGRIVTSAALLFAVAFGAFLTSKILVTKELGFGTASAVLIDATIIRALLVPSLMHLLGRWNWWAPRLLRPSRVGGSVPTLAQETGAEATDG